ncbi:MAG: DUF3078 domain-containing protein [Bacteroidales bacterium]|jgi:hypothetical protein|nr:DUF3078 domain-containing protein [Bacteroidales bacterium]
MKKNLILASVICLISISTFAQDTQQDSTAVEKKWKFGLTTSINFSQVSFTNWAAGGSNSLSLNSFVNTFANYHKDRHLWENGLQLGYGTIYTKDEPIKKSDDRINFDSKYSWSLNKLFRLAATLNFKTQFSNTFEYKDDVDPKLVSSFMAPGYLSAGIGIDIVPLDWLTINVSPAVARLTFVTIEELQVQYGNDLGQICKTRFGGLIKIDLKKEIFKNVEVASNLLLFTDYLDEAPFDVIVNWDVFIIMRINKFLSANLTTNLIWDKDILTTDTNNDGINDTAKVQFKELFGIGFTFSF